MNKKGFTLIELLAVIVILAIIALIATPIVLNIISDTDEQADLRSADFYLDAVELSIAQAVLDGENLADGNYTIKDGNICRNTDCTETLPVEVKGEVPKTGTIYIKNGQIDTISFKLSDKAITKNSKGELVYVKTLDEVCTYISGTEKTAGAKYECKVDPNRDPYTFYVLSYLDENGNIINDKEKAVSVNLIMDSNIRTDGEALKDPNLTREKNGEVAWINASDYATVGGTPEEWGNGNSNKGPITAMNYLEDSTKNWTNTNEIKINEFNRCDYYNNCISQPMAKTYNIYARMPYKNELNDYSESAKNEWMYDCLSLDCYDDNDDPVACENATSIEGIFKDGITNIQNVRGYWTLSATTRDIRTTFAAERAFVFDYVTIDAVSYIGVRPVISLKFN